MEKESLKTIIIDDDKFQLAIIGSFVEKTDFLELMGSYSDPKEAIEVIVNEQPDLLLVDIEMPEITGLELIKSLDDPPLTIIITGKQDYAVEAFELDVLDYLVKPVDNYARFMKAINKARDAYEKKAPASEQDSFFVKEDSLLVNVNAKDIMYVEAFGDYVKIITLGKTYIVHSTLSKISQKLSSDFVKVHRSFIVRLDKIQNIDQSNIQVGEKIIPVSQSLRPALMKRINTL